jgi:predicted SnoaL-like aldol condensation-catalyzing enzyme
MREKMKFAFILLALLAAGPAFAQAPASQTQLDANKKLVLDFFNSNALGDPQAAADKFLADDYVQHNPRFVQFNQEHNVSSKVGFVEFIKSGALAGAVGQRAGAAPGGAAPRAAAPARVPAVVVAEGDLVTVIWKNTRPLPGDATKTYEVFAFDTFRIRDGKFVEHWDNADLPAATPAAPASAGAPRQ